jgi:hypothetical protein
MNVMIPGQDMVYNERELINFFWGESSDPTKGILILKLTGEEILEKERFYNSMDGFFSMDAYNPPKSKPSDEDFATKSVTLVNNKNRHWTMYSYKNYPIS